MKNVYKPNLLEAYDLDGLEKWLEQLAQEGLQLKTYRPSICTFVRDTPRKTRYRVEYIPGMWPLDETPRQLLELYDQFGWDYVGEAGANYLLLFRDRTPDAQEPHTDPPLQGELLSRLVRRPRRDFLFSLILFGMILAFSGYSLWQNGTPALDFATTEWPFLLLMALAVFPTALVFSWRSWRRIVRLSRQLKDGIPWDHQGPPAPGSKNPIPTAVSLGILILYGAFIFFPLVSDLFLPSRWTLGAPDSPDPFPLLYIQELEGEVYTPGHLVYDGVDLAQFLEVERSLLCPRQWRVAQAGELPGERSVRLEIRLYQPLIPALSLPMAGDLLIQATSREPAAWWMPPEDGSMDWELSDFSRDGLERLTVGRLRDGALQLAVVAGNGRCALVEYNGPAPLEEHLEELAALVS